MNSYRTHTCSELRAANIGKPTTLIGWVDSVRDHGGVIFIDLRDRSGITQVVFHPEVNQDVAKASQQLRSEDMIQISGTVAVTIFLCCCCGWCVAGSDSELVFWGHKCRKTGYCGQNR